MLSLVGPGARFLMNDVTQCLLCMCSAALYLRFSPILLLRIFCRNYKFNDVHVDGARRLARIARESGVERFIHMSHLNAQPNPPAVYVKGGSQFLKSKVIGHEQNLSLL